MIDSSKLFELDGKVALVTGSGQGLGKEIAISLAQHGCSLILADLVPPEETAAQVQKVGGRCLSLKVDISDENRVKHMIEQGGGNIINIASTAGINGVPRATAYCASKAGVILLTKSLALEWVKYKIRVNAIAPHYIETALTRGLRASEKIYDGLVRQIPMRRFAQPQELIGIVLLLSSSASSYITGAVIIVDGGFLAA